MPEVDERKTVELDNEELKAKFSEEVEDIESEEIREYVEKVSENAPKEFWESPASSSGKYHPPEDNVDGGLVIHSIKCKRIAEKLVEHEMDHGRLNEDDKDVIMAGSLLHDIKQTEDIDEKEIGHGEAGYRFLDELDIGGKYEDIKKCVRYHMGKYSEKPEDEEVQDPSKPVEIVQYADRVASSKEISFLPDIDVPKELIKSVY